MFGRLKRGITGHRSGSTHHQPPPIQAPPSKSADAPVGFDNPAAEGARLGLSEPIEMSSDHIGTNPLLRRDLNSSIGIDLNELIEQVGKAVEVQPASPQPADDAGGLDFEPVGTMMDAASPPSAVRAAAPPPSAVRAEFENDTSPEEKTSQVTCVTAQAPIPDDLERHITEIRQRLRHDKAEEAIGVLTRQYNRARIAFGLPPALPSSASSKSDDHIKYE